MLALDAQPGRQSQLAEQKFADDFAQIILGGGVENFTNTHPFFPLHVGRSTQGKLSSRALIQVDGVIVMRASSIKVYLQNFFFVDTLI